MTGSPGSARPALAAIQPTTSAGASPSACAVGQRDRAVALGQPCAVGAQHERHVRVPGRGEPEQPGEQDLPGRRVGQVGTAHDLTHALEGVVDHHGQVVGRRAVAAAHHEVVDDAGLVTQQPVGEVDPLAAGAQAQRRRAPGGLALGALRRGQLAAGARVRALGQRAVGGGRGLADLGASAEARVEPAVAVEPVERVGVQPKPLRLANDGAVPVDPDCRQVGQLAAPRARA